MPTKIEISLDVEQYRKQLDAIIGETRQAAAKMSAELNTGKSPAAQPGKTDRTIDVTAKVSGKEDVDKLDRAVRKLPAKKTVDVNTKVKDTDSIHALLFSMEGGFKKLVSSMLGGVGALGIITAGFASAVKIVKHFCEQWYSGMKEAGEMSERNASSIAESAAVNEKYRQAGEGALRKLSELANVEKMSNVQKAEAVSLIAKLTRQYGDLGISIDRTTGKITGLDQAMVKRLEKDKDRRIREMEAQLKDLQSARNQQDEIISSESFWSRLIGNGKENTKEAQQKREALGKQIRELMVRLNEERQSSASDDYIRQQHASNADVAAQTVQRAKDLKERKWQDRLADTEQRDDKIDLLDQRLQQEQAKLKNLQKAADDAARDYAAAAGNSGAMVDAERRSVAAHAEIQKAKEKIYGLERQIQTLENEEGRAVKRKIEQSEFELNYQKLIVSGEYDKAAALKQEYDLRQQNLRLTDEEKQKILDQKKAMAELNLQVSNRDKAQNLAWSAMEKAGLGREAAEQRALLDAEKTKGGKLTDNERESVSKLVDLTWKMQNQPQLQMGDLSIRTNSLTSRGGFQGGAVMPDKDQVNKAISLSVKQTYDRLGEIKSFLDQLNSSVRDSAKVNL